MAGVSFTLFLIQTLCGGLVLSRDIFLDVHGYCNTDTPFHVTSGREFLVRSVELGHDAEMVNCRLRFQAESGSGVCFTFEKLVINQCTVGLLLEEDAGETESGYRTWKAFDCHSRNPGRICTPVENISVHIWKPNHDPNSSYEFVIKVTENGTTAVATPTTGHGPVVDSYAFVIGIIVVIVFVLAILALILCCCCRGQDPSSKPSATTAFTSKSKPCYESYTLPSANAHVW